LFGEDGADEADDCLAVGKIPTESVRRRISRFSLSLGLFDQICAQMSFGNPVNARMSERAPSRCSATAGSFSVT